MVHTRLLGPPLGIVPLLTSRKYRVLGTEDEVRSAGHILRAYKMHDSTPVVVKCVRRDSAELRMLGVLLLVQKQGERLPTVPVIELIEDPSSEITLIIQEDWGHSLAELGPLPPADFFHILSQCFEAVAALHAKGVAHLDISCHNFLCNINQIIAVIDFETSRYFNPTERNRSSLVYPHRTTEIPPEYQAEGAESRKHCAYKVDIFALGVLILRFAKSSGFDYPQLVLLAEPLVELNPLRRPTAAEALVWFQKWCERVGVHTSHQPGIRV